MKDLGGAEPGDLTGVAVCEAIDLYRRPCSQGCVSPNPKP